MPLALWALAIGAFAIGTTEFVVTGVLPGIADEFGVSISTAGYIATTYAMGVFVGAPLVTVIGARVERRRMLAALMVLFVAGNLITSLAPTFAAVLVGRVVASFTHGAFFGIGAVVAADLVAPNRRAGAIAFMFTGLTLANVVGVPAGTLLGQYVGWRATFAAITLLGVVGLIGVLALVPRSGKPRGARLRPELAALANPQVVLAMAMTVLGFGGVFVSITYIAPMMVEVAGFAESGVTWLLVLFGLGMVVGNTLGGRFADVHLMPMLYTALGALAVVLLAFTWGAHSPFASAVCVFLIGAFGFATVPPLQKRVMDKAAAAPALASALNIGFFNLGNAIGAWLGGFVIAQGFGLTSPNWAGALLPAAALLLAVLSAILDRRDTTRPDPATARKATQPTTA
ncbi:DHA1 family inner membrane transport protein [Nocardiopsis mwathae]|uniref:DHA1 family inner membrane transport protein n=1 Tax=Nocardiopsis mwathae TaxID=1472723 RepID=A0A7X0D6L9_9ACTN|nr:MFS transporter [Nocardiopsis mwathae]MBB6173687.1 DHA1 family inner membrane transport protein [Nocardiopsis mwathae]